MLASDRSDGSIEPDFVWVRQTEVQVPSDETGILLTDPVRVTGITLTAGILWTLTRSGGLLTSILMGVPAWRHVDLLPVLANQLEDDEPEDGPDRQDDPPESGHAAELFDRQPRQQGVNKVTAA